jgi:hypothetical protein
LKISGSWWWAGSQRVVPKASYLPDSIKKLLSPYVKEHGSVLFSTFDPNSKRYAPGKPVKVTKEDVRKKHRLLDPFYQTVLISSKPFNELSSKYMAVNSNSSFSIFRSKQISRFGNYMLFDIIAAEGNRYYDFVCIFDQDYIKNARDSAYQISSFIDYVHYRFNKQ